MPTNNMKRASLIISYLWLSLATWASSNGGVAHLQPVRVPVIMAQFTDVQFNSASTTTSWNDFFNSDNYSYDGATGSVKKYFRENSFGQYVPVFDIIGPVTLSHNQKYYGENDSYDNDMRADEMVAEACNLAENLADFTQYDMDGDGKLDAVIVLYAGQGEVYGVTNYDAVWAYTANLEDSEEIDYLVQLDGKTVSYFCAVPELQSSTKRDGIGTLIHEFAHILGLPNLCVTDGGTQKTLGDWDVMDHGSYNNQSRTPANMSAYECFYLGWVEPILLDDAMNVRLRDFATTGDCAIITASGQSNLNGLSPDPREFYILENRQQSGWDAYLPGHGLMLTKIDYVKNKWESDEVNNVERHPCVDLIEADGSAPKYKADNLTNGFFGKQGDLFPSGATEYRMFSNKMYFENVREQGGVILFDFLGGLGKCTVNFSVTNGTAASASLTESSKGAGVILPSVTADAGYTFLGWTTRKNSKIADAGQSGERFYPMSDCSVFAIMQDNTRYWYDHDIKGVVLGDYIGFNGYVRTDAIHDVGITYIKKDGYQTPTANNCFVHVECGGKTVPNSYIFDADTIRVSIPAAALTGDIFVTIINVREQKETGCDAYIHTFTSTCYTGTAQDFSGYDWNVTIANDYTCDYDKTKGATFGSNTYPAGLVRLYTEETMGCAPAVIRVKASAAGDAELNVYVAGNQVGETEYLTSTSTVYTFEVENPQSGAVEIRLANTQKAMYLKQIEIDFVKLEEPDIPSGIETPSIIADRKNEAAKFLDNGQLFILYNGHI